jgi:hypothetical protein
VAHASRLCGWQRYPRRRHGVPTYGRRPLMRAQAYLRPTMRLTKRRCAECDAGTYSATAGGATECTRTYQTRCTALAYIAIY